MMRWYTVPCQKYVCFQHLHDIKGTESGSIRSLAGKSRLTTSWFDIPPVIQQDIILQKSGARYEVELD